ncbi:hypothetical protein [Shinella zoogloeoides]|uniref:hypothetical protein n=1 Tax=Shinella zoogloeoides TaxID=352475 RepID=UPI001F5617D1|nr:hypothetical protein [Shinella zoogloeoides]
MRQYSHHFSCLHDEDGPTTDLGRGTHYSVFRTTEWYDRHQKRLREAHIHDFAVIWDEDHDERVVYAAEQIYLAGLFSPVLFIGERKGTITIVASEDFRNSVTADEWELWKSAVYDRGYEVDGDYWSVSFENAAGISQDHPARVTEYLVDIDSRWKLGVGPHEDRYEGLYRGIEYPDDEGELPEKPEADTTGTDHDIPF